MARLSSIMLLVRDVSRSASFYSEALGLPVVMATDTWAHLQNGSSGTPIHLKAVSGYDTCG